MQSKIHPRYFTAATISCACGSVLETGSTIEKLAVEVCSNCHPFYTGKKKVMDTTGRVERFKKMAEKAAAHQAATTPKKSRAKSEAVETITTESEK